MSTRILRRAQIRAPFERVVERVSPFGSIGAWHPGIEACTVEGDGCESEGAGRGTIRTLHVGEQVIRERLDELGEGGRGYRYTQLEGPLAGTRHRGYLWIRDDGAEGATVEWAAHIAGTPLPEAMVLALMEGLMELGLVSVKTELERVR